KIQYLDEIEEKNAEFTRKFLKAIYGKEEFKKGDIVKLKSKNSFEFGKISHFIVKEKRDGLVYYNSLPEKIFGNELFCKATREIVKGQSKSQLDKEYKTEEIRLLQNFPDELEFNFKTNEFVECNKPPLQKVETGYLFPDCYITIRGKSFNNEKGKILTRLRKKNKNMRLGVCQILQHYDMKTNSWKNDKKINGLNEHICSKMVSDKNRNMGIYYFNPAK
ncbi:hypothetical protein MHBO_003844, partial [Bonamia ostreae]